MFPPVNPPGQGAPQYPVYIDGQNGAGGGSFQYPGVGQLARGTGPAPPAQSPHGLLAQLIQQHLAQAQQTPHFNLEALLGGGHHGYANALPPDERGGGHQGYPGPAQYMPGPGPDLGAIRNLGQQPGGGFQDNMVQHFTQVHAAQNLARFLAQQHTGGLRRYNGRT